MPENTWKYINIILTIAGIITAISIAYYTNKQKSISYKATYFGSVIDTHKLGKINDSDFYYEVKIAGKTVKNPFMYNLSIINSGDIEIEENNFKKPFTINLNRDAKLLFVKPKYGKSNDEIKYKIIDNKIELEPFFLNIDDSVNIMILSDEETTITSFDYTISGIKEIKDIEEVDNITRPLIVKALMIVSFFGPAILSGILYAMFMLNINTITLSKLKLYMLASTTALFGIPTILAVKRLYMYDSDFTKFIFFGSFIFTCIFSIFYMKRKRSYNYKRF